MKPLSATSSFLFAVATAAQTARMPSQAETIAAKLMFCGRNAEAETRAERRKEWRS
jgi:hypothetical protein